MQISNCIAAVQRSLTIHACHVILSIVGILQCYVILMLKRGYDLDILHAIVMQEYV